MWHSHCEPLPVESLLQTRGRSKGSAQVRPRSSSAPWYYGASLPEAGDRELSAVLVAEGAQIRLKTAPLNMPGLSQAKGVSGNGFLSSCIVILHFRKLLRTSVALWPWEDVGCRLW